MNSLFTVISWPKLKDYSSWPYVIIFKAGKKDYVNFYRWYGDSNDVTYVSDRLDLDCEKLKTLQVNKLEQEPTVTVMTGEGVVLPQRWDNWVDWKAKCLKLTQ